MTHVVNYCSQAEIDAGERNIKARIKKADSLTRTLDDWQNALTVEFSPLPLSASGFRDQFDPIWIQPSSFGDYPLSKPSSPCLQAVQPLPCSCITWLEYSCYSTDHR